MTLSDLKIGQRARVTDIAAKSALRQRIMDMGITQGAELTVRRAAPLGDPLEVVVRGYALSIRAADGTDIEVEPLP